MTLQERIKKLRTRTGLTQKEFAEAVGVGRMYISGWETGQSKPGKARLFVIADRFNVRREWLESGKGEMFEPGQEPKSDAQILEDAALVILNHLNKDVRDAVIRAVKRLEEGEETRE